MIEVSKEVLLVEFPEIHPKAKCTVSFVRTLRVPDNGKTYPLPAGLGNFPLTPVEDTLLSQNHQKRGGVVLPLYQHEALWISFDSFYPFAVKVASGKVNAATGTLWSNELPAAEQDYLVLPDQPWLDGFCTEKGIVRQFVATRLGDGITVEEQVTGRAEFGGIQLIFYPMKASHFEFRVEAVENAAQVRCDTGFLIQDIEAGAVGEHIGEKAARAHKALEEQIRNLNHALSVFPGDKFITRELKKLDTIRTLLAKRLEQLKTNPSTITPTKLRIEQELPLFRDSSAQMMGLGLGGKISQDIYKDRWGFESWQTDTFSRCFIHLVSSDDYQAVAGKPPPSSPISVEDYQKAGIPWFEYKDSLEPLNHSPILGRLKSLMTFRKERTGVPDLSASGIDNLSAPIQLTKSGKKVW